MTVKDERRPQPQSSGAFYADPPQTMTVHERDRAVRLYGADGKRIAVRRPIGFRPQKVAP